MKASCCGGNRIVAFGFYNCIFVCVLFWGPGEAIFVHLKTGNYKIASDCWLDICDFLDRSSSMGFNWSWSCIISTYQACSSLLNISTLKCPELYVNFRCSTTNLIFNDFERSFIQTSLPVQSGSEVWVVLMNTVSHSVSSGMSELLLTRMTPTEKTPPHPSQPPPHPITANITQCVALYLWRHASVFTASDLLTVGPGQDNEKDDTEVISYPNTPHSCWAAVTADCLEFPLFISDVSLHLIPVFTTTWTVGSNCNKKATQNIMIRFIEK